MTRSNYTENKNSTLSLKTPLRYLLTTPKRPSNLKYVRYDSKIHFYYYSANHLIESLWASIKFITVTEWFN